MTTDQFKTSGDLLGPANSAANPKTGSSKYDYVKIKVWLGRDLEHYYILSRFLIARMLEVTKVPQDKAIKIALALKKYLVDHGKLDIAQTELETVLFTMLRGKGFGEEYVRRFKLMNRFQQQKRPLIILICGSACSGKSSLAHQLASKLNLPNVLQTDALYELLRHTQTQQQRPELWTRQLSNRGLLAEFQEECRLVRKALDADLEKCIKDGKSIIIEGLHLDPELYLTDFKSLASFSPSAVAANKPPIFIPVVLSVKEEDHRVMMESAPGLLQPAPLALSDGSTFSSLEPGGHNTAERQQINSNSNSLETSSNSTTNSPLEQPLMSDNGLDKVEGSGVEYKESIVQRVRAIQQYLTGFEAAGVPVLHIGIRNFQQVLEELHDHVLAEIEACYE